MIENVIRNLVLDYLYFNKQPFIKKQYYFQYYFDYSTDLNDYY